MRCSVAVILPTLNEEDHIEATLDSIGRHDEVAVIVCDGGSTDTTVAKAERWGAQIIATASGRATQMNAGAAAATAAHLLFLHADTQLPEGWKGQMESVLADAVAGAFAFASDWNTPTMRLFTTIINWRGRWFQRPYGDQGIFLRAETFHDLGGFPDWPLLEDVYLIHHLKKQGRIAITDSPVITSSRRWQHLGPWQVWLRNQCCLTAYHMGISPETIAKWYKK